MSDYGVKEQGFVSKSYDIIKSEIEESQRSNISPTWDVDAETPTGQMNGIVAGQLAEVWEALEDTFNGLNTDAAEGTQLDNIGKLVGVARDNGENSEVWIWLTFDVGTNLTESNTVLGNSNVEGQTWVPKETVNFDAGVQNKCRFICQQSGAQSADSGSITVQIDLPEEASDIQQPYAASIGYDAQSESGYRSNLQNADANLGIGSEQAIAREVLKVAGVSDVSVVVNSSAGEMYGIPSGSVSVSILDGSPIIADNDEVAQAIFLGKPPGLVTDGTETGTATDYASLSHEISFNRIGDLYPYVRVEVQVDDAYIGDASVLQQVLDIQPGVGEDLFPSQFVAKAMQITGVRNASAFIGTDSSNLVNQQFAVPAYQKAVIQSERVTVVSELWSNL